MLYVCRRLIRLDAMARILNRRLHFIKYITISGQVLLLAKKYLFIA